MKTEYKLKAITSTPDLEDLLRDAEEWLNNIDFLSDEIRFLKKVIDNYLNNLDEELKERLEQVQKELSQLELEKQLLRSHVANYLENLDLKMKAPGKKEDDALATEKAHEDIQYKYHLLNKLTREFKDHLFSITADIYGG